MARPAAGGSLPSGEGGQGGGRASPSGGTRIAHLDSLENESVRSCVFWVPLTGTAYRYLFHLKPIQISTW